MNTVSQSLAEDVVEFITHDIWGGGNSPTLYCEPDMQITLNHLQAWNGIKYWRALTKWDDIIGKGFPAGSEHIDKRFDSFTRLYGNLIEMASL
jgi:hypothetical protein